LWRTCVLQKGQYFLNCSRSACFFLFRVVE